VNAWSEFRGWWQTVRHGRKLTSTGSEGIAPRFVDTLISNHHFTKASGNGKSVQQVFQKNQVSKQKAIRSQKENDSEKTVGDRHCVELQARSGGSALP
jgi:hypothetical protein